MLSYAINVTLDGCCHHEAGLAPDAESMRFWTARIERARALLYGRVTYEMMESAWRRPADGRWPAWMDAEDIAFAEAIDRAPKHVVSRTLTSVAWNAELLADGPAGWSGSDEAADLGAAVRRLIEQTPGDVLLGGVALPDALADLGLIDEYVFVVHPVIAGHGPTLLAGLRERIRLDLIERIDFRSGATALRYRPA
ncbi:dihydrofolate reductase family protein [Microbacterium flavum]|uniref:Dihydrofolate reductase family protein n=1 Tax=Microbacterium flavum TaxID=415216 RepID=A0ABS5XWL9_9MICO|nr:dihydrofolate reductase family protein [Microbacterium flavum]MBT8798910.1 dihydrofolate reductase family protein [Microbacterium flavum]